MQMVTVIQCLLPYNNGKINSFLPGPSKEADKRGCKGNKAIPKQIQILFTGIGYDEGTFSLQVKSDSKIYQALPR